MVRATVLNSMQHCMGMNLPGCLQVGMLDLGLSVMHQPTTTTLMPNNPLVVVEV
jgi:hypothetical protein